MTIQECYAKMGGDYEAILGRLGSQAMVERFSVKFLNDSTFEDLMVSLEDGNWEEAFRAVHTLKGVAANLSISRVEKTASDLTEELRGGKELVHTELLTALREAYGEAVEALREFQG